MTDENKPNIPSSNEPKGGEMPKATRPTETFHGEEAKPEPQKAGTTSAVDGISAEAKSISQSSPEEESSIDLYKKAHSGDVMTIAESLQKIKTEVSKVIIGNEELTEMLMVALFSGGNVLLEGVPGVAKTLSARMLAQAISTDFCRIQFTPDLMPTDILGTTIYNLQKSEFEFKKGPIFSNIILIDEVNRAPAKTQAALMEVMEENQVTVEGVTYDMAFPFFIIATQNPVEQEGTYKLPEAQMDRFLFRLTMEYPALEQEKEILNRFKSDF